MTTAPTEMAMGQEVRLVMKGGATYQGFVFCCDPDSDVVVLGTFCAAPSADAPLC